MIDDLSQCSRRTKSRWEEKYYEKEWNFWMLKSLTVNFLNLISVDRSSQNTNMSESLLLEMGIMDIIKFTDSMFENHPRGKLFENHP